MGVKYINLPKQYQGLKEEITAALEDIFSRGDFVLGKPVEEFEQNFASYCGCRYAIGVANGTDALILVLKALDIAQGDEVITAPNSFLATAGSIIAAGAKPVFVDVTDDYNIDPSKIEAVITEKTKAIMPVHLTGRPAEMEKIMEISRRHNLKVIEDSAQAAGAMFGDKKVGTFGDAGCFSLHPLKTLNAAGDGGMITTNSEEVYSKLMLLRNHGLKNRNEAAMWGYNSRLDSIQAAIANIKLKYLDGWNKRIREIARLYRQSLMELAEKGSIKLPKEDTKGFSVYHTFMIQSEKRDELQQFLLDKGIETKIHYPLPIHLQEAAKSLGYKEGDFPNTEMQAKRILSLPIYPELKDEEIKEVCDKIKEFFLI